MADTTPMMRQYLDLKSQHHDKILFFRLGDFYEMFREDARDASVLLNLTLTHRQDEPMCGVPYHSSGSYIRRLLEAGRSVALCEQVSEAGVGKGLVRREIVDILTPGTLVDDLYLTGSSNNFLMAFHRASPRSSIAVADLSTGKFLATSFLVSNWREALGRELGRFRPREILLSSQLVAEEPDLSGLLSEVSHLILTQLEPWRLEQRTGHQRLLEHFGVLRLEAFGLNEQSAEVITAGALLDYLKCNTLRTLAHLEHLEVFQASDFLQIDPDSARSLELLANTRDGGKGSSLYGILDVTKTTAGSRLLENWLRFPLLVPTEIEVRQVLIESLVMDSSLLRYVRKGLSGVLDLDRLASRLALDKASARDLLGLEASLARVLELATLWDEQPSGKLLTLEFGLESRSALSGVVSKIAVELSRDPSPVLTEGGLIKEGVSAELDELRHLRLHSQEILQAYLGEEKAKTGLSQLKLKQNRIIGYYFEVSKARLERLPEHFQRRQSLIGSERYSTERLRELEDRLQHAEERIFSLERELFWALRDHVKVLLTPIQRAAAFSARLDVVSSLAQVALDRNWVRPLVTESLDLVLEDARHPVVEANSQEPFVPNSVHFSAADSLVLITGPNMAGKSTYLRQTALIVLLAQTGSFVPCRRAEVGITDRIFCRVGASDHLSRGESTFLVEMHETARILRSATPQSLVIMDEVGRGTSTRDGFSLAWAICEYLLDTVRAKTLFATHFHELTALSHPALRNFSMAVEDDGREVVFLRKVVKGASDNSYGLHVARLAGVPARVVDRAAHILESLEPEHTLPREQTRAGNGTNRRSQLDLFVPEPQPDLLREELRRLDPDNLTPFQALQLLAKWKALSVE